MSIAVYIHQKFASKQMINVLSSLSFCENYTELKRLHSAISAAEVPPYDMSGFTQFMFDNADFNILVENLSNLKADKNIPGRIFGDINYAENLLDSQRFDKAGFYRWITSKNKEMLDAYRSSNASSAFPNTELSI